SLKRERNLKNVLETLTLKYRELRSYYSAEAAWESFQLSAARTHKSSSEATCDDK
ncbi:hypothetical protein P7K49_001047, partial [Saguinus oedipus]